MAIQNRRGDYADFDPQKMLPGEWATVLSGDPNSADGMSVYMCFKAGIVKRMATYEDMVENVQAVSGDAIAAQIQAAIDGAIKACETATASANTARANADKATQAANDAASLASQSKTDADAATERAIAAAEACEGLTDNTRVAALEKQMAQVIETLKNVLSTESEESA
ncbi:MAG: hypothetical protein Q4F83_04920 [Eubacteriales bacterium]|nr:hypothetical protein [Eubacteriales bacterium]